MLKLRSGLRLPGAVLALAITSLPAAAQEEGLINRNAKEWRGIAEIKTIRTKTKLYKLAAQYPVFRSKSRLARYVNGQLKKFTLADYNDFLKETKTAAKEGSIMANLPYDFQTSPTLSRYAPPNLISLSYISYRYTGGAHGLPIVSGVAYGMVNGKPKAMTLADLFVPGTDYRSRVEKTILAKLKQNPGADWVKNGDTKFLTPGQLNNFTVEKNGVKWWYSPYEMGPYSSGIITAKLTSAELGAGLRKSFLWGK